MKPVCRGHHNIPVSVTTWRVSLRGRLCNSKTCFQGTPQYSKTCLQGTPQYSKTCLQGTPQYSKTCLQGTPQYSKTCLQGTHISKRKFYYMAGAFHCSFLNIGKIRHCSKKTPPITRCPLMGVSLGDGFYCTHDQIFDKQDTMEYQGASKDTFHKCICNA